MKTSEETDNLCKKLAKVKRACRIKDQTIAQMVEDPLTEQQSVLEERLIQSVLTDWKHHTKLDK